MKNILMIATGGTIACVKSENGLVPNIKGEDIINLVPELKNICSITTMEIMNIDSSNLSPNNWIKIIETIEKYYNDYDGFVITHGTDTMAYTSSYLSNAIENINKPIILTGSQLSIEAENTDAKDNIYHSFLTACSHKAGVFLVFNGNIHCGHTVKKVFSEDFEGFCSINNEKAGVINNGKIIWNIENKVTSQEISFNKNINENIFIIKMIPSLKPDIIDVLINMGYKGIIIEGYGAGGVPTEECENNFIPAIKKAVENNITIVCATQCLYNGVHLDKYPMGIMADKYGAISAKNQTLEYTLTKLMIGLGNNMDKPSLKEYMEK